ncbi:hypothetical protein A4X13_0g3408 [Tilletia indica]|uniref:ATP-dependent DNA helicase n=1 Tax=Tilletia indica TaxID=43049 RepID=A0A8T8T241_9BASI|nr:hypothetical protein A4X13_0g3408 [Tilletia indica]
MTVAGQMGIYTFKIQGQLCHKIGSLLPPDGVDPAFAQVYFVETDPASATGIRMQNGGRRLDIDIVSAIEALLRQVNPYARLLLHARPLLEELSTPEHDVAIKLLQPGRDTGADPRTYNRPSVCEVAALIVTPTGSDFAIAPRDILIRYQSGDIRRISHLHASFLPLRFPILIPYGHFGWQDAIPLGLGPRALFSTDPATAAAALQHSDVVRGRGRGGSIHVSLDQFHAYHVHERHSFSTLFVSQTLFQEWLVDAWVVTEQNRISFLNFNQDMLRREVYSGLRDALLSGADLNNIGTRTILPSTFTNGPRFWQARYHDAMSLVRVFGKPDLFITMTCNPKWEEITKELRPGQVPSDRPDLVTRVFNLKLRHLLHLLLKVHVLGVVAAYVHSVEFQKRGLPHAHILLILATSHKLRTRDDVDSVVSAELPDPATDEELFDVISTTMIHGPCTPGQSCMNDPRYPGKCSKGYPMRFRDTTSMDSDGYPDYRRRDHGIVAERRVSGGAIWAADNTWVVPHNRYLSKTLACHLNVEVCSSMAAVKYLYKYVLKGPDHISIQSDPEANDEIQNYLNARYVSPCEAMYRVLSLPLHGISPSIRTLDIHLPNQQPVTFSPDQRSAEQSLRESAKRSKLLAFFDLCVRLPNETADLTYPNVPMRFVWHQAQSEWRPRQRGEGQIGRIFYVPHTAQEKYYLRRLLHEVASPKSFDDLYTFEGRKYSTFRAACSARGLLTDDAEWHRCLDEAAAIQSGAALRHLFCLIIFNNEVEDIPSLYDAHKLDLADDCAFQLRLRGVRDPTQDRILSLSRHLLGIEIGRLGNDKSLADFGIPAPDDEYASDISSAPSAVFREQQWDRSQQAQVAMDRVEQMNDEQRDVYHAVTGAVDNNQPATFFLHGSGGCGKTFVMNAILAHVRGQGLFAIAVASSGIAALMLEGGRTSHFRFKLPLGIDSTSSCSIRAQSDTAQVFRRTALFVWDEAPMMTRHAFEAVDRMLQDIRKDTRNFGGCTMLMSGDWKQTLPVVRKASEAQVISVCLHNSHLWNTTTQLRLSVNVRLLNTQGTDLASQQAYGAWILDVGTGQGNDAEGTLEILQSLRLHAQGIDQLCDFVYDDLLAVSEGRAQYFRRRAILHSRNSDVDITNAHMLDRFPGYPFHFYAADRALDVGGQQDHSFTPEYLASLAPSGLPPYKLTLKLHAVVMMIRNLDPSIVERAKQERQLDMLDLEKKRLALQKAIDDLADECEAEEDEIVHIKPPATRASASRVLISPSPEETEDEDHEPQSEWMKGNIKMRKDKDGRVWSFMPFFKTWVPIERKLRENISSLGDEDNPIEIPDSQDDVFRTSTSRKKHGASTMTEKTKKHDTTTPSQPVNVPSPSSPSTSKQSGHHIAAKKSKLPASPTAFNSPKHTKPSTKRISKVRNKGKGKATESQIQMDKFVNPSQPTTSTPFPPLQFAFASSSSADVVASSSSSVDKFRSLRTPPTTTIETSPSRKLESLSLSCTTIPTSPHPHSASTKAPIVKPLVEYDSD